MKDISSFRETMARPNGFEQGKVGAKKRMVEVQAKANTWAAMFPCFGPQIVVELHCQFSFMQHLYLLRIHAVRTRMLSSNLRKLRP
ncbi:hypothetical protein [Hydrogenophaga sp.]|uniref:hypothetical protein n=1 Tax=Hydrogenophaga sp. TaxID=1904254 RepID=UPI00271C8127|nr:hypothetical protein [Hydrogenophaga sp.]MDO9437728.1 hypothetical protein [Hydrogenophaga sp.]